MIAVRLAMPEDEDEIVEMARTNSETRPTLVFNEERTRKTFRSYLDRASPTFWVAYSGPEVLGFLCAEFYEHRAFDGLFTAQEVLFVKPEKRGTRAATLLMRELISWSKLLGANEIVGGNDNATNSDRTAKFLSHFGFEKVGHAMRMTL